MKLEVGMYCRTINGIQKFIKETDDVYAFDKGVIIKPDNIEKYIIKASHNIIDLIEVRDVIVDNSGRKIEVNLIRIWNDVKEVICNDYNLDDSAITLHNSDIFKVLTKEQFENNCYKIGD